MSTISVRMDNEEIDSILFGEFGEKIILNSNNITIGTPDLEIYVKYSDIDFLIKALYKVKEIQGLET